ncbi:class I SAM-dependent methyltransferase [Gracilibacillus marinus]|jgi:SAM-dependent methyltransferase|uniref:Class I SAM-dependent methyltransferase n=1 Tax=Gracilibacillus marinus TaxID=630535 RepID=A0ABV8VWY9_9BACI
MQYSLLKEQYENHYTQNQNRSAEQSRRMTMLKGLASTIGIRDTPLFQLLLFSKIKNYIRFITLRQIYKNFEDVRNMTVGFMHPNIFHSFMNLGVQLEMVEQESHLYRLRESYMVEEDMVSRLVRMESSNYSNTVASILEDYLFVTEAIEAKPSSKLGRIMNQQAYIYMKEVLTYLQEINQLNFFEQITPSFTEDFYTDLGELAFNIYTKENYQQYISQKQFASILDIGCGNGNYIDIHINHSAHIVGVERQEKVYEKLQQKYRDYPHIQLFQEDILDIEFNQEFDMINMSYMLFYLTVEEKEALFNKLKKILGKNGIIVICQYYPDFEVYQELIARYNGKWGLMNRYKFDICNSILAAEVVLNNMLVDFAQAEEWEPFLQLIESCGFEVEEIVPADETYYSYFITIKHKSGGSDDKGYRD